MEKLYTIGDAAAELGMPASTIRFYEKNGLIPNQQRSSDGRRLFDEDDLEWMRFVERLKVSGIFRRPMVPASAKIAPIARRTSITILSAIVISPFPADNGRPASCR